MGDHSIALITMNYIVALILLGLISPPTFAHTSSDRPHEYRISEVTRSIAYGKACAMADAGGRRTSIRKEVLEIILAYESKIEPKDAAILGAIVSKNAIRQCGNPGSN